MLNVESFDDMNRSHHVDFHRIRFAQLRDGKNEHNQFYTSSFRIMATTAHWRAIVNHGRHHSMSILHCLISSELQEVMIQQPQRLWARIYWNHFHRTDRTVLRLLKYRIVIASYWRGTLSRPNHMSGIIQKFQIHRRCYRIMPIYRNVESFENLNVI